MGKKTSAVTSPPRGTRDFLPEDLRKRRYAQGIIQEVYEAHGFAPLETPTYERLDTLLEKYGDEGEQLVFKILHRGQPLVEGIRNAYAHLETPGTVQVGRSGETAPSAERLLADYGLRYDLTVPLARVMAAYGGKLPSVFKRYQIQPVWRADQPGKGRFREFYQCDVDVVGASGPTVEAEILGAVSTCLDRLGFSACTLRLNHRAILRAVISVAGVPEALETSSIVALDKLDKIGVDGVMAELEAKMVPTEAAAKLLDLVSEETEIAGLRRRFEDHQAGKEACEELDRVMALASVTPAADKIRFAPTLARGLGYYTGAIFEIAHPDLAGSLGGGGRYDGLIGMFSGRDVPACGCTLGLERILVVMDERNMFPELLSGAQLLVGFTEADQEESALQLAYRLRAQGWTVDLQPKKEKSGKLKKQAMDRNYRSLLTFGREGQVAVWNPKSPDDAPTSLEASEFTV